MSIPDIIAAVTALVSIPYLAGFFHWAGYLHGFGINASEVSLAQSDYLLAALNLFDADVTLVSLGPALILVLGLVAALLLAWWALRRPMIRGLRPNLNRPLPDGAAPGGTFTVIRVFLAYVVAAALAMTVGYGSGTAWARRHMEGGTGQFAGIVVVPGAGADRIETGTQDRALSDARNTRFLFSDGTTIFLFAPAPSGGAIAGRLFRVPIDSDRSVFSHVRRID